MLPSLYIITGLLFIFGLAGCAHKRVPETPQRKSVIVPPTPSAPPSAPQVEADVFIGPVLPPHVLIPLKDILLPVDEIEKVEASPDMVTWFEIPFSITNTVEVLVKRPSGEHHFYRVFKKL